MGRRKKVMDFIFKKFFPKNSIRALLIVWFLLFALVPVGFVTGYSLIQFQKFYSDQTLQKLNESFEWIQKNIEELSLDLKSTVDAHMSDATLSFYISTRNITQLKRMASDWLRVGYIEEVSFFNKEGEQLVSLKEDQEGFVHEEEKSGYVINSQLISKIGKSGYIITRDIHSNLGLDVMIYTKIINNKGKLDGYLQEVVRVDADFLMGLKRRYGLEVFILDANFKGIESTQKNFLQIQADIFKQGNFENIKYLELKNLGTSYAMLIRNLASKENPIYLGLATSQEEILSATQKINKTVMTVVGVVILFILLAIGLVSKLLFSPIENLLGAVKKLEQGENPNVVPESSTEIGLLTKNFNDMSKKVTQAQAELTTKVQELEQTNKDLQAAQTQLVHSAKMSSLGQIVAGVAHELNNPIGFIFSNMNHLRSYSKTLFEIIQKSTEKPEDIDKIKNELDYSYIEKDLPQLIKSCEDGAKRVRDIVLNLRNFSRTDENDQKEFNLEEGLESTLNILTSDIKNRIQIHKNYSNVPNIFGYPGQMNQVFMNIISNAIQSIEGKGEIWIQTEKKGLEIFITIRDSGKGISNEHLEKIFDPFFTTKPVGQGTGLGLSISYGIVQKHHGEIRVTSEIAKGTTFTLVLPLINPKKE